MLLGSGLSISCGLWIGGNCLDLRMKCRTLMARSTPLWGVRGIREAVIAQLMEQCGPSLLTGDDQTCGGVSLRVVVAHDGQCSVDRPVHHPTSWVTLPSSLHRQFGFK